MVFEILFYRLGIIEKCDLELFKGRFCPKHANGGWVSEITGNAPQNNSYGAFRVIGCMFLKAA